MNGAFVGRRLGGFELVAWLADGGMGSVYRAHQASLGRDVAVKVLAPWLAHQPGFRERFLAEARTMAALRHPNIVAIYEAGEQDGLHYLTMELLRGKTLADRMADGLTPVQAILLVRQVAAALDYAHRQGVIHRDVKPQNILVEANERAVLTDFGIARLKEASTRLTTTGVLIGTPAYMAPEQTSGGQLTGATDQYALAVMLFELLGGRCPFDAPTPAALMYSHAHQPPPPLSTMRPGLPAALDGVLARGLAKRPEDRFPNCTALVDAADAALQGRWHEPVQSRRPNARPLVVVAVVLSVFALLAGGLLLSAMPGSLGAAPVPPGDFGATQPAPTQPAPTPLAQSLPPPRIAAKPTPAPTLATRPPPIDPTPTRPPSADATPTRSLSVAPTPTPVLPPVLAQPPTSTPSAAGRPRGQIVFVMRSGDDGNDLFLLDLGSREARRVTGPGGTMWSWAPAISPDGTQVAFNHGVPGRANIAVARLDGGGPRVVAAARDGSRWGSPWWRADGTLTFHGVTNGRDGIYELRPDGQPALISDGGGVAEPLLPTWPRSRGALVFAGKDDTGTWRIWVLGADGRARPVSRAGVEAYAPAWAPEGRRIAFQGGGGGIVTVAPDGSGHRIVVPSRPGGWTRAPAWSSDGRWIAYVAGDDPKSNHGDLYVVPSEGGTSIRLTTSGTVYDWRPAWLP